MTESKTYIVVLRAQAGLRWPPDGSFTINQFPSRHGKAQVVLRTHRMHQPGFSKPVARGLHVEVSGTAPSLPEAIDAFTEVAELVVPILCTVVNAPIAQLQPELGYDATPGIKDREYFQQYLVWPSRKPLDPRPVDNDHLKGVLLHLPHAPRNDRVHRAMSYYHQAMLVWIPGAELIPMSFIWMGIEAMTPVVRDQHLVTSGLSRKGLLTSWKTELKAFDPEVRKRLIFGGDRSLYDMTREVSDGLEHGYEDFTTLRAKASKAFIPAARALRSAILTHCGAPEEIVASMLSPVRTDPFPLFHAKRILATLHAPTDTLSKPDQLYPYLDWSSSMVEVPTPESEDPGVTFQDKLTLNAAEGVTVSDIRIRAAMPRTKPAGD